MDVGAAIELERNGKLHEAEDACRRALMADASDANAIHLLGRLALRRGAAAEAVERMKRSVALRPQCVEFRIDLAAALGSAGQAGAAIPQLIQALRLGGTRPEVHNNIGAAMLKLGRPAEAIAAFRNALRLRGDYAEARHNLANALRQTGHVGEAITEFREALRHRPDYAPAHTGLAAALLDAADLGEALRHYRRAVELEPRSPGSRSALLYTLHYDPKYGPEELFHEHVQWGQLFCDPLKDRIAPHENDRSPDRRLRVGYVSPDFRQHTVPHFVTAALEHHDPEQFEIYCYSDVEKPDSVTERLKRIVEHWAETRGLGKDALALKIRDDRIDILVDLRGHAAENRLPMFCLKPAPVQVNMVGYFDTTGLSTMDYRITDDIQDPVGETEQYHTEQLVRLPQSCWCYTADEDAPDVAESRVLKNGHITFGSLNKIIKVSEPCARLWARVLDEVPGSKLLLSVAGADAGGTVRKRLESYGLPPERLEIVDKTRSRREYLMRFNEIDIALDTWPFNGITTTCDGLWMGVPCVSMTGRTSVSRAGKSILHAATLAEFSTESPEAFVEAAVSLARDIDRLRELRRSMRQRLLASALMDHRGFARNLESAYRAMWRAWCGQSHFSKNIS